MENLMIVRGGGDLATGTIYKLKKCGFPVLILETESPSAIRRNVAFSEAVYEGQQTVEDMTCYMAGSVAEAENFLAEGKLTLLVDPAGASIAALKPLAVVDAILAKKNLVSAPPAEPAAPWPTGRPALRTASADTGCFPPYKSCLSDSAPFREPGKRSPPPYFPACPHPCR